MAEQKTAAERAADRVAEFVGASIEARHDDLIASAGYHDGMGHGIGVLTLADLREVLQVARPVLHQQERNRRLAANIAAGTDPLALADVIDLLRKSAEANLDVPGPRVLQVLDELQRVTTQLEQVRPVIVELHRLVRAWSEQSERQHEELVRLRAGDRPVDRPEVVTLCGSMRFLPLMLQVAAEETAGGAIVLAPFSVVAPKDQGSELKARLDELHRRKIDLADRVVVVTDETGYYGYSTSGEITYARDHGKPVAIRQVPGVET